MTPSHENIVQHVLFNPHYEVAMLFRGLNNYGVPLVYNLFRGFRDGNPPYRGPHFDRILNDLNSYYVDNPGMKRVLAKELEDIEKELVEGSDDIPTVREEISEKDIATALVRDRGELEDILDTVPTKPAKG